MVILFRAYLSTNQSQQHIYLYQDGATLACSVGTAGQTLTNFDRIEFYDNSNSEVPVVTVLNTVTGLAENRINYDQVSKKLEITCGIRNLIGNRLKEIPTLSYAEIYPGNLSYILWEASISINQSGNDYCLAFTHVETSGSYYWHLGAVDGGGFIAPSQLWTLNANDDLLMDLGGQALGLVPLNWGQFRTPPQKAYYRFCKGGRIDVEDPIEPTRTHKFQAYVVQFERCMDLTRLIDDDGNPFFPPTNPTLLINDLGFEFDNTSKFWLFQQQSAANPKEVFVGVCNLKSAPAVNHWNNAIQALELQLDGVEGTSATLAPQITFVGDILGTPISFRDSQPGTIQLNEHHDLPPTVLPTVGPVQPMPIERRSIPGSSAAPPEAPIYSATIELRRFSPTNAGSFKFAVNPIRSEFVTESTVKPAHKELPQQRSREILFPLMELKDAQLLFPFQFYENSHALKLRLGELDFLISKDETGLLALNAAKFRIDKRQASSIMRFSSELNLKVDAVQFASSSSDDTLGLNYLTILKNGDSLIDGKTYLKCRENFGEGIHHIDFELNESEENPVSQTQSYKSVRFFSEKPFFIGQVSGTPIIQRNSDSDSPLLGFCKHTAGQTSGWRLRSAKKLTLELGPQGVGEEIDKYPIGAGTDLNDLEPNSPAEFHFTPGASVSLDVDSTDQTYLPPLWNLGALFFNQKPEISEFKFESLYSLSCSAKPSRSILEELSQDIGLLPSSAETWRKSHELPESLINSAISKEWELAKNIVAARPVILTPKNLDVTAASEDTFQCEFEARHTSQLRLPPGIKDNIPGHSTNGVASGLSWVLSNFLPEDEYKMLWNGKVAQGTVTNTKFTSLGTNGAFEAQYELPPTAANPQGSVLRISGESSMGRLSKIIAVREGRIGVLGNRAVAIETYERTVATVLNGVAADEDFRAALKLTKRDVLVIDKTLNYPDNSSNSYCNGFIRSSHFASERWENVAAPDASGNIDLSLAGKHVSLNLAKDAAGNTTTAKLSESNVLHFQIALWNSRTSIPTVDYPEDGTGQPEKVVLPASSLPSHTDFFNTTDADDYLPDDIRPSSTYRSSRYHFLLEPTIEPVNILYGKQRKEHLVQVESIILSRLQMNDQVSTPDGNRSTRQPLRGDDLSVVYAIWKPLNTRNLRVNRKKVLGFFPSQSESGELEPIVTNPCAFLINREHNRPVKDMSYRIPFNGISEQLTPAWKKRTALAKSWPLSKIFPNMAGMQLEGMTNDVNPDVFNNSILTFDQSVEGKDQGALLKMKNQMHLRSMHLFSKFFVKVELENVILATTTGFDLLSGAQVGAAETDITADWTVRFGEQVFLICEKLKLGVRNGSFNVKFGGSVKTPGLLSWLNRLFSKDNGSGASVTNVSYTGGLTHDGVEAGINISYPSVDLGLFALTNVHLLAGLTLYWNPEWIVGVRLSLARKQKPFSATVFGYDGGGWFYALANYHIASGNLDYCVGVGITVGIHKSVNFSGIKGSASLTLGFCADYCNGTNQAGLRVTLFLLVEGELDFFGIASAKVSVLLAGTYRNSPSSLELLGEIRIEIDICWCFTLTVHKRAETVYFLDGSNSLSSTIDIYGRTEADFLKYATSYVDSLE